MRSKKMSKILIISLIMLSIFTVMIALNYSSAYSISNTAQSYTSQNDSTINNSYYYCPMHKDYVRHESGYCPYCGMSLSYIDKSNYNNSYTNDGYYNDSLRNEHRQNKNRHHHNDCDHDCCGW